MCPQCYTQFNLPPKGVAGLSTNFTLVNLTELYKIHETTNNPNTSQEEAVLKCESGLDEDAAVAKCLQCDHYLCRSCANLHRKLRIFTDHRVLSLSEISDNVQTLEQTRYCPSHDKEELKLYCLTCREVVCRDCTIVTHKSHDFNFIRDVHDDLLKELTDAADKVESKKLKFLSSVDMLEDIITNTTENARKTKHIISSCFNAEIAKLEKRRDELNSKVEKIKLSEVEILAQRKDMLQGRCTTMNHSVSFATQLVSSASKTDLALMSKQALCQLNQLIEKEDTFEEPLSSVKWAIHKEADLFDFRVHRAPRVVLIGLDKNLVLGKNTVLIKLVDGCACISPEVKVEVALQRQKKCTVHIDQINENTWQALFFASLPGTAQVMVEVCGVPVEGSPFQLECSSVIPNGVSVRRGPGWSWGDQDGGPGNRGVFVGYNTVANNLMVYIKWDGKDSSEMYRWGMGGIYDIEIAPPQ